MTILPYVIRSRTFSMRRDMYTKTDGFLVHFKVFKPPWPTDISGIQTTGPGWTLAQQVVQLLWGLMQIEGVNKITLLPKSIEVGIDYKHFPVFPSEVNDLVSKNEHAYEKETQKKVPFFKQCVTRLLQAKK